MDTTTLKLSALLKNAVVDAKGKHIAALADIIVRLSPGSTPRLTGLVLRLGSGTVYAPAAKILAMNADRIELASAQLDLRPFERRAGEVLLRADVLGHRMIDIKNAAMVRAYDVQLESTADGWAATGLDTHHRSWFGLDRNPEQHPVRRWDEFEPLIGHTDSLPARSPIAALDRLKAPQLADLLKEATAPEQHELLAHVHANPELEELLAAHVRSNPKPEADVFEEPDDDNQPGPLASRSNDQTAAVLGRMRPDDAADALMGLPENRRMDVLNLMPYPQRTQVTKILGYQDAAAGGLMGLDFVQFPPDTTVGLALTAVSRSTTVQLEALTVLFSVDSEGRLTGALGLAQALQLPSDTLLLHACAPDPVFAMPEDDVIDVANKMADFNLLMLPVLDPDGRIQGVITVDDALEAAIPQDWRRSGSRTTPGTTGPI